MLFGPIQLPHVILPLHSKQIDVRYLTLLKLLGILEKECHDGRDWLHTGVDTPPVRKGAWNAALADEKLRRWGNTISDIFRLCWL